MSVLDCNYVSSKGLLRSCVYIPNISGSSLKNHGFSYTKNYGNNVKSIYVCSSALENFVKEYMNKIKDRFVVVSGDSDMTIHINMYFVKDLLNNPKLVHIYIQNAWGYHEKLTKIPIGLDYHTFNRVNFSPLIQENLLISIKKESVPFNKRKCLCFVNFGEENLYRIDAHKQLSKELIYKVNIGMPREKIWKIQTDYAFVISPFGNGIDCHRTWEALVLGSIPIVKNSPIVDVFNDLPVLIINKWRDITIELLETTIKKFTNKKFNYNKLNLSYWSNLFNSHI